MANDIPDIFTDDEAENLEQENSATSDRETPGIAIGAQYIKDLSFEVPGAPGIFNQLSEDSPDIEINVNVQVHPVQEDGLFEVILHVDAKCNVGESVAFILELSYGSLVQVTVPEEDLHRTLLVECPQILFPFARYIVADTTRDSGFPPLMLGIVDFEAMYINQVNQQQDAAETETT